MVGADIVLWDWRLICTTSLAVILLILAWAGFREIRVAPKRENKKRAVEEAENSKMETGVREKSVSELEAERAARGINPDTTMTTSELVGTSSFSWSLEGIERPTGQALYAEELVSRKARMKCPDWNLVKHLGSIKLWEAVALSLEIDPACLGQFSDSIYPTMQDRDGKRFEYRLQTAESHLHTSLPVEIHVENLGRKYQSTVSLRKFVKWAIHATPWDLPRQFKELEFVDVVTSNMSNNEILERLEEDRRN